MYLCLSFVVFQKRKEERIETEWEEENYINEKEGEGKEKESKK